MISGLAHINVVVPPGTLDEAHAFYGDTLGLILAPVPALQRGTLAWYNIADSGQQVHVAFGRPGDFSDDATRSSRHPCFQITGGPEALQALQQRIWKHFSAGGPGAPRACDKPGQSNSGAQGVEYPTRFFARDFAGNRLEFSFPPKPLLLLSAHLLLQQQRPQPTLPGMRLRLIQIPAAPSLGVYPTYRVAAALQEILRRQFLDAKLQLTSPPGDLPPLQPTVISFTPSPTFTLGRRQHEADLDAQAIRRLQAPLTVVARDEDAEQDLEGGSRTAATSPNRPGTSRHVHDSYTFQPAVLASPRGGLTTYHGPGQAVLWPVLDLKSRLHNHFTVRCYSRLLEDTTADVLQRRFGVEAHTTGDPGLWVGGIQDTGEARKIAALGVHLRRNISALGVAVNLDMPVKLGKAPSYDESANPWARFVPCGLAGKGVTCVAEEGRRRFGNVPASWDLQSAPFAAKWAAALATRLGLDGDIDVTDDEAVRGLLVEARNVLETEGEDADGSTVDGSR